MTKIPKLKATLDLGHYSELVTSFEKESDRGAGIIAGSFVEHYLKGFLLDFMTKDQGAAPRLLWKI